MKIQDLLFSLLVFLLMTAACSPTGPGVDAAPARTLPQVEPAKVSPRTGTFFAIDEVGLGANGFVALTNFTDVSASLAGLYLCQGPKCFELPDVVVGADQTVRIAVGDGTGHERVVATQATLGELRPSDGELALSIAAPINDPEEMLVYLQWGSNPHELTEVALEAGLWVEGGYAPASPSATRLFKVEESGLWLFEGP